MDDFEFNRIIELVKSSSGIIPRDSHRTGILNFVEKRMEELHVSSSAYYNLLALDKPDQSGKTGKTELELLINGATVNETYFFREEAQFRVLKNSVLPELRKNGANPLRIWSAASSSGEEIYSLYLLATSMGINAECTASDINSAVLEKCRSGSYTKRSLKATDGAGFQNLLFRYKKPDGSVQFDEATRQKIACKKINLSKLQDFQKEQHLVFLRNVFIYFDFEMRKRILAAIARESLVPGGYLFVSMNEVATVDLSIIPPELEKVADGKVFYFRKKGGKNERV